VLPTLAAQRDTAPQTNNEGEKSIANLRKMRPENKNARRSFSDGGP
jgi:hypothetical protein